MKIEGKLMREGRWWAVHVPMLHAYTQGKTRKEALYMAADWVEANVNRKGFKAEAIMTSPNTFVLSTNDAGTLMALVLQMQRQHHGLTFAQAALRLGQKSPNAYARYESGHAIPSMAKLTSLLAAVGAPSHVIIRPGA